MNFSRFQHSLPVQSSCYDHPNPRNPGFTIFACTSNRKIDVMFTKSKQALIDLQKTLHCGKCNQYSKELSCLGSCQHWFCRSCAESYAGYLCPICGIPSVAKKTHVSMQLSSVASLCSQMMSLIDGYNIKDTPITVSSSEEDSMFETNSGKGGTQPCHQNLQLSAKCQSSKGKKKRCSKQAIDETPGKEDAENCIIDSNQLGSNFAEGRDRIVIIDEENVKSDDLKNDMLSGKKEIPAKIRKRCDAKKPAVSETPASDKFVKLKDVKGKGVKAKVVSDTVVEKTGVITPNARKRSSQSSTRTPCSGGKKAKTPVATNIDQQGTIPQTTKNHPSKNRNESNSKLDSVSKKATPQSGKKKQRAGLEKMMNLSKKNSKGETSLQVATIKMDIDKVRQLLDAGANPNVKDYAGWTPLHEAIGRGKSDIAGLLIANGASVNAPGMDNETPLHDAVINQHGECVRLLIDNGANIYSRNVDGRAAIDLAQNDEIKNMLLNASQAHFVSDVDLPLLDESSKPLCFTGSNLSKEESKLLIQYSRVLQAKIVQEVTQECMMIVEITNNQTLTHVVTSAKDDGSCSRTLKYLQGILAGKCIVNLRWMEACCKQNTRVPEHDFQVPGCSSHPTSNTPKRALENRLRQLPPLFDGCQVFFYGKFETSGLLKEELVNLVKQGGGVVLKREPHLHNLDDYPYTHPYHAQSSGSLADCTIYVLYDDACPNPPSVEAQRMACLPISWFLDSIATFSFLEKRNYVK